MAYSYNVVEAPSDDAPSVQHEIRRAKKFLQKHSAESGDSLYDHLTELLAKVLAERPRNAVDIFEQYSRKLKEERFKTKTDHLRDLYTPPVQYDDAKKLIRLFQQIDGQDEREKMADEGEDKDDKKKKCPNMLDLFFYLEQTGVGLPRHEMVLLNLSIRKLASEVPVENIRFWGKVLGKPKNYYVVEAELQADELTRRLEEEAEREKEERAKVESKAEAAAKLAEEEATTGNEVAVGAAGATEILREDEGSRVSEFVLPSLPVNPWQPVTEVPAERIGSGLNKKVYFVCNAPGLDEWIELPAVTPQQIVIARQIVRYCTGNLETTIRSFPPFPGTEKNYLRAQIARISAATHISPIGAFTLAGELEDEEMEEEERRMEGNLLENANYEPLPIEDLADPSNWCHHSPYILEQGRTVWWSPEREEEIANEELDEEEEAEEDETRTTKAEEAEKQREIGPPLLTPLSEDAVVDLVMPWTARQSSQIQPDIAVAAVRSNVWPGAFAFAAGKRFANVYIGWGHKYNAYNYSPPNMPPVQDQYKIGPEVMEIRDPTAEEEEADRIARSPPPPPTLPTAEEEEEEEEDDDEEEERDE
ncbi:PREDICTED: radial spoke head protein 6 homolog A [Dinoponera quadriceps]|uniref:Radial spoke head protein 6 homolog A n=1 Tax=Dinoponera quadriceps TaxID=609295 RepID=A0A6P3XHT8_DINQU|nr:PREDICTED: radial spoke head protein 6 homolog A [Dinoponera quadriceps]